jgi:hypothetical protein
LEVATLINDNPEQKRIVGDDQVSYTTRDEIKESLLSSAYFSRSISGKMERADHNAINKQLHQLLGSGKLKGENDDFWFPQK